MDLPDEQLQAPAPLVDDPSGLVAGSRVVAIKGTAPLLAAVAKLPNLETLWVSGVGAKSAELLGAMRHLRELVVHDLRAADLRACAELTKLESLAIAGSSRLRSLDGIGELRELTTLVLFGCVKYTSVEPLRNLTSLETLCLEGGFSKPLRIDSLAPLSELRGLVELRLASLRVDDGLLRPLHGLQNLRRVFIAKAFDREELRALARAIPEARGEFLDSYRS